MRLLLFVIFIFHLGGVTATDTPVGADIVFLLDSSDRIGQGNFTLIKVWLKSVMTMISIGPSENQVSFISYGGDAHVEQILSQSTDEERVQSAIDKFDFQGGSSVAAKGMRTASTQAFSSFFGGRPDRPQIIIHVGAGGDTEKVGSYVDEAKKAIKAGKIVFNVAIGNATVAKLLSKSSSFPTKRHFLKVNSAKSLTVTTRRLMKRLAGEKVAITSVKIQHTTVSPYVTPERFDIIFVIDGSSTITSQNFKSMKEDLKNVVSDMTIGEAQTQVGILQFSGEPEIEVSLNRHLSRASLVSAIDNIVQLKGESRIDLALETLVTMFTSVYGARRAATRASILITDGKSQSTEDVEAPSVYLRSRNVEMLAIGIGSGVDKSQLENITGDPSLVHLIDSYRELGETLMTAVATARKAPGTMPPEIPTTTMDPCFDVLPNCRKRQQDSGLRYCQHDSTSHVNCRLYCGFCLPAWRLKKRDCIDVWKNCASYDVHLCTTNPGYFSGNCDHFCGTCDPGGKTTGFHGKCLYKGKVYQTGDSWRDGCDYDCTCVNATEGKYQCFNRCPIYLDLPHDCTLVKKQGDCCLRPVCNFHKTVRQIHRIGVAIDSLGESKCEYNGTLYQQNEAFQDGCDFQCHCVNSSSGKMVCSSLCPTYQNLPPKCRMVQDKGACCERLVCEYSTAVGRLYGHGTTTGYAEGHDVTDLSCRDERDDCASFTKSACEKYKTYMTENCPVFCDLCEEKNKESKCYFENQVYKEGEQWRTRCNEICVCDNQYTGYVRCFNGCAIYDGANGTCKAVWTDTECCSIVHCPENVNVHSSTTNLNSRGSGKGIYRKDAFGRMVSIVPITNSNHLDPGNDEFYPKAIRGCLLHGQVLAKGEIALDGNCGPVCTCLNEVTGQMSCTKRCPTYTADNRCSMITSPRDSCCQVPKCPSSIPSPSPIYPKPQIIHALVASPDPKTLMKGPTPKDPFNTLPKSKAPFPPFTDPGGGGSLADEQRYGGPDPSRGTCTYKDTGKVYREGDRWTIECKVNCICLNGKTGRYVCTDVCKKFKCPPRSICTEYPDPDFTCCKLLRIIPITSPAPTSAPTTLASTTPLVTDFPTTAVPTTPTP